MHATVHEPMQTQEFHSFPFEISAHVLWQTSFSLTQNNSTCAKHTTIGERNEHCFA